MLASEWRLSKQREPDARLTRRGEAPGRRQTTPLERCRIPAATAWAHAHTSLTITDADRLQPRIPACVDLLATDTTVHCTALIPADAGRTSVIAHVTDQDIQLSRDDPHENKRNFHSVTHKTGLEFTVKQVSREPVTSQTCCIVNWTPLVAPRGHAMSSDSNLSRAQPHNRLLAHYLWPLIRYMHYRVHWIFFRVRLEFYIKTKCFSFWGLRSLEARTPTWTAPGPLCPQAPARTSGHPLAPTLVPWSHHCWSQTKDRPSRRSRE